nr:hypothetical protein [uncultured Mucilaginibacter sp.]
MKNFSYCLAGSFLALITIFTVNAQTIVVKSAPTVVKIDGNADEWKGYEESVNEKSHISYIISSDKDNLYLVLKTKDRKKQQNILGAGVTFSIDPSGKKKETFSTTFPHPDMDDLSEFEHLDDANLKMRVASMEFKKIRVMGFAGIPPLMGAQKNDQNIYASIKYTAEGELVLEEAIPLKLFAVTDAAAPEWAFNIKINGLFVRLAPSFGGGGDAPIVNSVGSGGGGRRGGSTRVNPAGTASVPMNMNNTGTPLTSSSDFWGKFAFAKQ